MSRTREIKVDELLDKFREVRERGSKILDKLEGDAREAVQGAVFNTTTLLADASKVQIVHTLSEKELDQGLSHCKVYLKAIENAEEMLEGTLPTPFNRMDLH